MIRRKYGFKDIEFVGNYTELTPPFKHFLSNNTHSRVQAFIAIYH